MIILLLFTLGLVLFFKEIYKKIGSTLNNKKDFSQKEFINIFFFLVFLLSFFILAEFNKSKYGGWRHLYFLYPIVIYFSLFFISHLLNNSSNIFRNTIFIFIFLNLINNLYWTMKTIRISIFSLTF